MSLLTFLQPAVATPCVPTTSRPSLKSIGVHHGSTRGQNTSWASDIPPIATPMLPKRTEIPQVQCDCWPTAFAGARVITPLQDPTRRGGMQVTGRKIAHHGP
eukprot:CAMPEP_0204516026 /NCGR_PEP_ID=MMETSP0661-20131031/2929_1 /ASSEMBLY_ACC=CAM_ASM_000606 /TAXON_ID=109239 /ORGANISM="Alexandrium margalefi, Strain AMGDE01CS-322" /LENGTH=101 /DNA_ID=CAMNT_0051521367 /DNA_START=16 /DNA_END=318 /DNA_ORIENTATION=+